MWNSIINKFNGLSGLSKWRKRVGYAGLALGTATLATGVPLASAGVALAWVTDIAGSLYLILRDAETLQATKLLEQETVDKAKALSRVYQQSPPQKIPHLSNTDHENCELFFVPLFSQDPANMAGLTIQYNNAYVWNGMQIFYVNKARSEIILLKCQLRAKANN